MSNASQNDPNMTSKSATKKFGYTFGRDIELFPYFKHQVEFPSEDDVEARWLEFCELADMVKKIPLHARCLKINEDSIGKTAEEFFNSGRFFLSNTSSCHRPTLWINMDCQSCTRHT